MSGSSSDDDAAFENFMSRLKSDRNKESKTAHGFIKTEAFEAKSKPKSSMAEYRVPKISTGSSGSEFEDALEDLENEPPKSDPPARQSRFSDDSSEDDETAFENFVSSLKTDRVGVDVKSGSLPLKKKAKSMDSFIVDDDELDETWTSGSDGESQSEDEEGEENRSESSPEDEATTARRLFHQFQLDDEKRLERKIICKTTSPKLASPKKKVQAPFKQPQTDLKIGKKEVQVLKNEPEKRAEKHQAVAKLVDNDAEFLYNLSKNDAAYVGNGDETKKLRRAFVKTRLEIATRVAEITNRRCFDGKLPMEVVTIEFTKRLLKTAGDTTTKGVLGARTCRVRLADKVCDTPGRLRDTLIHELCHATVTMIDGVLHHRHGPLWVKWTKAVTKCFPNLPPITVCHRYAIQTKYVYICLTCGHNYGRHSKSIDVNTHRCGHCHGILKLSEPSGAVSGENDNGANLTTPRSERPKNAWTTFVSGNFASVKREMPKSAHKDVMARLKVMYQSERAGRTRPDDNTADENHDKPASHTVTPVVGPPRRPNTAEIDEQIDLILASSFNFNLNFN